MELTEKMSTEVTAQEKQFLLGCIMMCEDEIVEDQNLELFEDVE